MDSRVYWENVHVAAWVHGYIGDSILLIVEVQRTIFSIPKL
jgi:hypothetical protein